MYVPSNIPSQNQVNNSDVNVNTNSNTNSVCTSGTFAGLTIEQLVEIDDDLFGLQAKIAGYLSDISDIKNRLISICNNDYCWDSMKGQQASNLYFSIAGSASEDDSSGVTDSDYIIEIKRIEQLLTDLYERIENKMKEIESYN